MVNDTLDFRRISKAVRKGKWLFAASIVFFAALFAVYAVRSMPQYKIKSSMLIDDDSDSGGGKAGGGMAAMMRTFSVGGFGASSVDNEMMIVASNDVMTRMVHMLNLNCTYIERNGLSRKMLYGDNCPIAIEGLNGVLDTLPRALKVMVKIKPNNIADVKVTSGRFSPTLVDAKNVVLPYEIKTKYGNFMLLRKANYAKCAGKTIQANVSSTPEIVDYYYTKIKVTLWDKKSDGIELSIKDASKERGKAILNTIMACYNEKRIERRKSKAQEQFDFYDRRIAEVMGDLSQSGEKLQKFQENNKIFNAESEAPLLLEQSVTAHNEAAGAQADIAVQELVLKTVQQHNGHEELIAVPASTGSTMGASLKGGLSSGSSKGMSADYSNAIARYNELVMEKREMEKSAKPGNTALDQINQELAALRQMIVREAEKTITASRIKLNAVNATTGKVDSKLNSLPGFGREYAELYRDASLKNELYMFLMQKKENSLLNLTSNTAPSFVVDAAYSAIKPDKLKSIIILLICIILASSCPLVVMLWWLRRTDSIDGKDDLPTWCLDNVVEADEGSALGEMGTLRSRLLQDAHVNSIYVYDCSLNGANVTAGLKQSLEEAGINVNAIKTTAASDELAKLLDNDKASNASGMTTLACLPADAAMSAYNALFTEDSALVVSVKKSTVTRHEFIKVLKEIDAKKCLIYLY